MFPVYRNQSTDLHANQLTGFYMMGTLVVNGLSKLIDFYSPFSHQKTVNFPKFV